MSIFEGVLSAPMSKQIVRILDVNGKADSEDFGREKTWRGEEWQKSPVTNFPEKVTFVIFRESLASQSQTPEIRGQANPHHKNPSLSKFLVE